MIQLIQDNYEKLAKSNENLTYDQFYRALHRTERASGDDKLVYTLRTNPIVVNLRTTLTRELCSFATKYIKSKELETQLNKEQVKGIERISTGLYFLVSLVAISLILGAFVSAKQYFPEHVGKGLQILCIFAVILSIVATLFNILIINTKFQQLEAKVLNSKTTRRFQTFDTFMFTAPNEVSNTVQLFDLLSTIDKVNENPKDVKSKNSLVSKYFGKGNKFVYKTLSTDDDFKKLVERQDGTTNLWQNQDDLNTILSLTFDKQVVLLWESFTVKIIANIHSEGNGIAKLSLTESKSDPIRILRETNQILNNYYKLMLKTYQSPDENISNAAILKILDNTVVSQLTKLDFSEGKVLSNDEFVERLEEGIHYALLKTAFKNLMIFMYLPWKVIEYRKLMKFSLPTNAIPS